MAPGDFIDNEPLLGSDAEQPINNSDDNELKEQPPGCCHPSSKFHRFQALILMCLLGFGSYFCYDNPAALADKFDSDLGLSNTQFTMLYSIYSWPNVVLCFIGGFLLDRFFGVRLGTIIYMLILLIGQFTFAIGGLLKSFPLMMVGRLVFGIGAESLAVAQNNYAVLWFKGKELNMVFGLQLSFARVGSTVNFVVMEPLYEYVQNFYQGYRCTGVVLLIASMTCVMSMICGLILGWMDRRAQRILNRNDNPSGEVAKLSDIITFKVTFWMVSVVCVAYYVAIFPFIALGKNFFITKFGFTPAEANYINSIVYIISAVASPFFGFIVDKTGKNVLWVFISICSTIGAHSILAFTMLNPYVGMSIMGISYSMLASSLWPLVALIIPEYQLGTAYGICQSVQNLGLAVVSILSGIIVGKGDNEGYAELEFFFIIWLIVSLLATIVIFVYDKKTNGFLNMSPKERMVFITNVTSSLHRQLESSESVDNIANDGSSSSQDTSIRNRYNKRPYESDCEPLLE